MATGPLLILSGPSGTGKSSIVRRLLADPRLRLSVSATTRKPREGERDGIEYHFWTRERFERELQAGAFLEWAEVYGNYYGTPKSEVGPFRERGLGVILDIDTQGFDQVRRLCPDAVSLFVRAPTLEAYEKRLRDRGTETEESIQKRLAVARRELARAGDYDHQIINDDLEAAVAEARAVVATLFERGTHA
jgi:guanylate kinase